MNTTSRVTPVELSRKQIDSQTVQAQYKAGYGLFVVNSRFLGDKPLGDLFFEILQKKQEICCHEQHDD